MERDHGPRIIPARAGFTDSFAPTTGQAQDHPRSRGVYRSAVTSRRPSSGSSPLARGLLDVAHLQHARRGIIPARAGFTRALLSTIQELRDHPRSRGVYPTTRALLSTTLGSSPLARGLLDKVEERGGPIRIIPARAGFTRVPEHHAEPLRDHPRSRGVYEGANHPMALVAGSSPLARGLHLRIPGIPTTSHTTRPRLPSLPT